MTRDKKVTYSAFGLADGRGVITRTTEEHYCYVGDYKEACRVARDLQRLEENHDAG